MDRSNSMISLQVDISSKKNKIFNQVESMMFQGNEQWSISISILVTNLSTFGNQIQTKILVSNHCCQQKWSSLHRILFIRVKPMIDQSFNKFEHCIRSCVMKDTLIV